MLEFWQNLPQIINPIAFSIGSFSVRWYSLGYLMGLWVVYRLLVLRVKKEEKGILESQKERCNFLTNTEFKIKNVKHRVLDKGEIFNLMVYLISGLLIGARLGYVIFYNLPYYLNHHLEVFLPIQVTNFGLQVTGISGMSYFGGLIGVIMAGLIFSRKHKLNFWQLADFVVPAIPAGYFFGRIGNFLNGELYGRTTDVSWGMYFPTDSSMFLRHPSQFYEAFFEGIVLFLILWFIRNKSNIRGYNFCAYLFGYGFFRFFIEFFREPDPQVGYIFKVLTLGQFFSITLLILSIILWYNLKRINRPNP